MVAPPALAPSSTASATPSPVPDVPYVSPVQEVNETTGDWHINPLPSNVTVINGTLVINETIIQGKVYNGTNLNGTVVIELTQPSTIWNLPLMTVIYMIMSILIIASVAYSISKWILAAMGSWPYKYTGGSPGATSGLTSRIFNKELRKAYSDGTKKRERLAPPKPSYSETPPRYPGEDMTSQGLREFREMIRAKYALDLQIWNQRFAHSQNQGIVDDLKRKSRGATAEMLWAVERWRTAAGQWSEEEYQQVQEISARIRHLENNERVRFQS